MTTHLAVARAVTQNFTATLGQTNRVSIPAFSGNDLVIRITVVDEAGDPVDISTYTTRNFGCYPLTSGTADFTATPAFLTDGTDGIITVTITDANTSAFTTVTKRIEVQLAKSGSKYTILEGVINFRDTYI